MSKVNIIPAGRSECIDLFIKSGIFDASKLPHTPFLAFRVNENTEDPTVEIVLVKSAADLLTWPDDTQVMVQWPGQWRSDFFHFKVGEYRIFHNNKTENYSTTELPY